MLFLASCVKHVPIKQPNYIGTYVINKVTSSLISNSSVSNNCVFENGEQYIENNELPILDTITTDQFMLKINPTSISFDPLIIGLDTIWNITYPMTFESVNTSYNLGRFIFYAEGTKRIWKLISATSTNLTLTTSGIWPNGNAGANVQITLKLKKL